MLLDRIKPLDAILATAEKKSLHRSLGAFQLTMRGEHKAPEFKSRNPKGKVPALEIDGTVLTENVAILWYLHQRHPEARLLPATSTPLEDARNLADLCFCSATLHPLVTRIRMPSACASRFSM